MTYSEIKEFDIEVLHPKIMVFKNVFKNSLGMIEHFEKEYSDQWTDWYTFGKHVRINNVVDQFDKFPTKKEWEDKIVNPIDDPYVKEFQSIFYDITKKYYESVELNLDNWLFDSADIAKYNADSGISEDRAMSYHTDYQQEKSDEPGNKFMTTCVFYLNDDYDEGEICFRIFKEDFSGVETEFEYKPSVGDAVVFPSTHPFYHGVNITRNGSKYILRSYWKTSYEGSPEYFEEKSKYTEEEWPIKLKEKYQKIWKETGEKFGKAMS